MSSLNRWSQKDACIFVEKYANKGITNLALRTILQDC